MFSVAAQLRPPRRRRWTFQHFLAPRPPLHGVLRHRSTAQPRLTNRALTIRSAARRRFRAWHVLNEAHHHERAHVATRRAPAVRHGLTRGCAGRDVAPQHRPLAATSTSTTGASRTPCLVRRVRQSPDDATDCDTSASRPRLAHDRVVHVECRLPLQLRRDRAAGRPSAIARPHRCTKRLRRFYRTGDRRRRKTKRDAKRCDRCAADAPSITSYSAIGDGHRCSIVRVTTMKSTSWRRSVAIYRWMLGRPC